MEATNIVAKMGPTPTKLGFVPSTKRHHFYQHSHTKLSFNVSSKPKFRLFATKPLPSRMVTAKAQLNKVAVEGSNNSPSKSGLPIQETKFEKSSEESSDKELASEESISEFLNQVADLVKLVDSRDIVELKLKQQNCEIMIRKKLAIQPSESPAYVMMQSPQPIASSASTTPPPTTVPALPAPSPTAVPAKSAKSSVPPVLSPMAGTFYRCPGPGEPPFVKVGDKVQKGQVLCIIEAMKLMNEIQAEQTGTLVEVIAEDGKPVSRDSPLFAIQP